MARLKRAARNGAAETPAPQGHNKPPLTEDEVGALTTHYALKIIADQRKVDAAKVDLDAAKSVVNGHFKMIAKDLGFTRKDFAAEVVAKLNMTEAEYASSEKRRDRLHRLAGLKEGQQIDLIDHVLKDTADEAEAAFADGYRAGRRADDPKPPAEVSPILHPDWMRGWHEGQTFNGAQLMLAAEILARPAPGTMVAGEEPEAEGEPELDPDAEAKKLKAAGWTEPTAGEQQFETVN